MVEAGCGVLRVTYNKDGGANHDAEVGGSRREYIDSSHQPRFGVEKLFTDCLSIRLYYDLVKRVHKKK